MVAIKDPAERSRPVGSVSGIGQEATAEIRTQGKTLRTLKAQLATSCFVGDFVK